MARKRWYALATKYDIYYCTDNTKFEELKKMVGGSGKGFFKKNKAKEWAEAEHERLKKKLVYYAVIEGYTPGLYDSGIEAQKQINRFPNGKMEKFSNKQEAIDFLEDHGIHINEEHKKKKNLSLSKM